MHKGCKGLDKESQVTVSATALGTSDAPALKKSLPFTETGILSPQVTPEPSAEVILIHSPSLGRRGEAGEPSVFALQNVLGMGRVGAGTTPGQRYS